MTGVCQMEDSIPPEDLSIISSGLQDLVLNVIKVNKRSLISFVVSGLLVLNECSYNFILSFKNKQPHQNISC